MYTYTKEEFIMVCYTCDDATDDCILDFVGENDVSYIISYEWEFSPAVVSSSGFSPDKNLAIFSESLS